MTENKGYYKVGSERIKLRTPQYIYIRLLLLYTFLYTLAFAMGCLLFHFLKINEGQTFSALFPNDLAGCTDIFSFCKHILAISRKDLSDLFVVFTAGFTMLAGFIASGVLLYRGFSLGFTVSTLVYALRANTLGIAHPVLAAILFSSLSALGAVILLHLSVRSTLFSDDFKALCGRPGRIIRSGLLYAHIFRFLIAFGAFLLLNLIRCFI